MEGAGEGAATLSAEDASDNLEALALKDQQESGHDGDVADNGDASASGGPSADLSQHGELWLQEIEAVDDYWGPTFRAVYESCWQEPFLELLERRIGHHDQEIEKMCNHHYQGFISSVRQLLTVRADAATLRTDVTATDQAARQSADRLSAVGRELVQARRAERNIAVTIEHLSLCLPVLQVYIQLVFLL
jgi:hypothetical protein